MVHCVHAARRIASRLLEASAEPRRPGIDVLIVERLGDGVDESASDGCGNRLGDGGVEGPAAGQLVGL